MLQAGQLDAGAEQRGGAVLRPRVARDPGHGAAGRPPGGQGGERGPGGRGRYLPLPPRHAAAALPS